MFKQYIKRASNPLQQQDQCRFTLNSSRNLVITMEGEITVITPLGTVYTESPQRVGDFYFSGKPRASLRGWIGMTDDEREAHYQKEIQHWEKVAEEKRTKGELISVERDVIHPFIGEYNRPARQLTTTGYAKTK